MYGIAVRCGMAMSTTQLHCYYPLSTASNWINSPRIIQKIHAMILRHHVNTETGFPTKLTRRLAAASLSAVYVEFSLPTSLTQWDPRFCQT